MGAGVNNNTDCTACWPLTQTMNAEVSLPATSPQTISRAQSQLNFPPRNLFRLVQLPLFLPLQVLRCQGSPPGGCQAGNCWCKRPLLTYISCRERETPRSLISAQQCKPVIALAQVRLTTVSPRALWELLGSQRTASCRTTGSPMSLRSFLTKAGRLFLLSSSSTVTR